VLYLLGCLFEICKCNRSRKKQRILVLYEKIMTGKPTQDETKIREVLVTNIQKVCILKTD
jgi:hypothetical protein